MKTIRSFTTVMLLTLASLSAAVAQTNTLYFMDGIPQRNTMNPAFMPNSKFYLDFVVLPNLYFGAGNNSLTMKDIIFNQNGKPVIFLNPDYDIDKFYKKIKPSLKTDLDFQLNLLSFGFSVKEKNYLTFDLGIKANGDAYIPKDLFKLALYGTPNEFGVNSFNLSTLGLNASIYSELALGYMRKINEHWSVGGKLKFLMGYADMYTINNNMQLDASQDSWKIRAKASIYGSLPVQFGMTPEGEIDFSQTNPLPTNDYYELLYNPAGLGGAIDIGATYKPIENLTISAAVTDLGLIHWRRNLVNGAMNGEYEFTGVNYTPGDTINFEQVADDFLGAFDFSTSNAKAYNKWLTANLNVGVEYGILENKISFGALSRTRFSGRNINEEVTLAANFRPIDWFRASVSYSFINGRWSNVGAGINLRVGPFNTFIIADYIPCNYARVSLEDGSQFYAPYNTQRVNVQMGLTLSIGRDASDKDRDGVKNRKDKCPNTDIDYLRKLCPDTKKKELVDINGCTVDTDNDGVPDCYDKCPNTPQGVVVDQLGCPVDTDKDGIADYLDKCPDTPLNVSVDSNGCPLDGDGDGVPDYLDKCPNTPEEAWGTVDANGCPKDSDGDGVADYLDKCPNTPQEAWATVDSIGCPKDSDGDGVADYLDQCPDTPKEAWGMVDKKGCPLDSDGDGVLDYLDKCPTVPGPASNNGCPVIKEEVKRVFKQALQGIQFETGKDVIKKSSYAILNQVAKIMKDNPDFLLTIAGHTDNVGDENLNLRLSEKRAASVRKYLINKGVAEDRITSVGYGESQPVESNSTAQGRALNRRVEFLVRFER